MQDLECLGGSCNGDYPVLFRDCEMPNSPEYSDLGAYPKGEGLEGESLKGQRDPSSE